MDDHVAPDGIKACGNRLPAVRALLNSTEVLNAHLALVKAMFPTASASTLRKLLASFDRHHAWQAAQALLRSPPVAVGLSSKSVRPPERFRSPGYQRASLHLLLNEFPLLWKYQIHAVLAECNCDYPSARVQCHAIHAVRPKGWLDWWARPAQPVEFTPELWAEVLLVRTEDDAAFSAAVNRQQYAAEGQLLECSCCCDEVEFERMVACLDGHLFCTECIRKRVADQTYSQLEALRPLACFSCDDGGECPRGFPRGPSSAPSAPRSGRRTPPAWRRPPSRPPAWRCAGAPSAGGSPSCRSPGPRPHGPRAGAGGSATSPSSRGGSPSSPSPPSSSWGTSPSRPPAAAHWSGSTGPSPTSSKGPPPPRRPQRRPVHQPRLRGPLLPQVPPGGARVDRLCGAAGVPSDGRRPPDGGGGGHGPRHGPHLS
eukprot:TRINITY_DN14190_c0_g1_i1.p1 TRINITY_DN14190_c0_g1~~TRINITY_DN14190_c0_g1_i1.p1  ORF type:complete len:496 (-),score=44.89 TRINITY_DN14190_c0_g1_i1:53-1333(-)